MSNYKRIRISFTSFISKVIQNTAINYKKRINYISIREMQIDETIENSNILKTPSTYITDTLVEDINYLQLEKVFTNEKYSNAMKNLSDREKLVLYLAVIEELPLKLIANMLETTEDNISKIKYRAKNKFLDNLKKGDF